MLFCVFCGYSLHAPAQKAPASRLLIAFGSYRDRPKHPNIFFYDRGAKKTVELPGLNIQSFEDRLPALSGDGRWLAFTSNRKGGVGLTDIYLYDRKESKLLDLPKLNSPYMD